MDPPWHFCLFLCFGDELGRSSGDFWALTGHIPPSLDLHIYISLWYTYLGRPTTFLYPRSPWSML